MGDEELNFTEQEAQCWANDPRNQAYGIGAVARRVLTWILLLIAMLAVAWLAGSGRSMPRGGDSPISALSGQ